MFHEPLQILSDVPFATHPESKKRGRPSEITDMTLFHRRDTLLGTFEFHWAEIAWELQRAGTLKSIRQALQPIPEPRRYEFEPFLYKPTKKAIFKELRELRRAKDGSSIEFRKALPEEQEAKRTLDNLLGALKEHIPDVRMKRLLESYQRRCVAAKARVEDLRTRIDAAENGLREHGAYVAQSELLDFMGSQRYTLSPLSFANAMAGLPFITWRQSASRCVKTKAGHAFLNIYEQFLDVERALIGPPQTAKLAIEQAKAHLRKGKRQRKNSTKTLKEEWYYLRLAIASAYSRKPPKDAIPYRVFAEYRRRSSARSQLDQVMEKEERLQ